MISPDGRICMCVGCYSIFLDVYTDESLEWANLYCPSCGSDDRYGLDYDEAKDEVHKFGLKTISDVKTALYELGRTAVGPDEAAWKLATEEVANA